MQIGIGDRPAALAALERAFDERSGWMPFLGVEPALQPLESEPRYQALLARVKLPAAARRARRSPSGG